jgi:class 3 adenylate cyclase
MSEMVMDWQIALRRHNLPEEQLAALVRLVRGTVDSGLYYANPRYLVERLVLPERVGLNLLLTAVAEGLFRLNWHITCPACGGSKEEGENLADLDSHATCGKCQFQFVPHLDDEISVTMTATETFRAITPPQDNAAIWEAIDKRLGKTSALSLINLPAFQRLVVQQNLPQGQWLGVNQLVIFFSDLRQSTAFYHRLGDAEAYHWVREHFQVMFAAVERYGGTAVKTIGDGIMGVFTRPEHALNAIAEGMNGMAALNEMAGFTTNDGLSLKVGVHRGACIVVGLNGRLDYFGETVNIAARLAGLSAGGEIILSPAVLADSATTQLAEKMGHLIPLAVTLRGLSGNFDLYRLTLPVNQYAHK